MSRNTPPDPNGYEYPPQSVRMEEDEIRTRAQSLRSLPRHDAASARAGGAAISVLTSVLTLLRIPLSIIAALITFAIVNGLEGSGFLIALGAAVVGALVTFILVAVIRHQIDAQRFRHLR